MKSTTFKALGYLYALVVVILTFFNIYVMVGKPVLPLFQEITPFAEFAIAVFWVISVFFTIRTFMEIKRQTQILYDAFLMVTCGTTDEKKPEKYIDKEADTAIKCHNDWERVVRSTDIPNINIPGSYLTLTLTNKGKSDIVRWRIKMSLVVNPGDYLESAFKTRQEAVEWEITSNTSRDIIVAGGDGIPLVVAKHGAYPHAIFSWKIDYSDMRNKDYESFSGDNIAPFTNALVYQFEKK